MNCNVLLLDQGWTATLHLAAGLTAAGFTVHCISADPGVDPDPKYLRSYVSQVDAPSINTPEYMRVIEQVSAAHDFTAILPLTENILYRLWDAAEPSSGWAHKLYPATETWQRDLLGSKQRLSEFVAERSVSVPESWQLASFGAVPAMVRQLGLPLVVKGVRGSGGTEVRIAQTEAQVVDGLLELTRMGEESPVLQQYIEGETYLVGGLFHEGTAIRLYAAEKTAQHPARTGPSISLRSTTDGALLEQALSVFRELRWSGLASADFVRGADGRYYFLEVNPRPWGAIAAARTAGVELFKPFAALLRGDVPASDVRFRAGVEAALFPQYLESLAKRGGQWH